MSFKVNDCQQLSFDDSFMTLKERERKALEKSWVKIFVDEIFSAINEECFSVLYSDKAGKLYRGYVANMEESVGKNGSVVTDYQFHKNTHTDSHFLQDSLKQMEKSEEEIILVTDGVYLCAASKEQLFEIGGI